MDAQAWDARYAADDIPWPKEPNSFVVEIVEGLEPGRALDLACGDGRNARWLARRGWRVTGVDFSAVALAQARRLSSQVAWVEADVRTWTWPVASLDLVLLAYLHLAPGDRQVLLAAAASWLDERGTLAIVGHDRRNLAEGTGGPRDPGILLDPRVLAEELPGLEVIRAQTAHRRTPHGLALDAVVVATRPEILPAHRPSR